MDESHSPSVVSSEKRRKQKLADNLRRIERKDWWLWGYTVFVILLLTGAVLLVALPSILQGAQGLFGIKVKQALLGLVALVVLFNVYTVHQQVLIKRLRHQLVEKESQSQILRSLAMIDPLTGLYNRRFAERRLETEVARSFRKGHPLLVILLDIDNFKQINDSKGHQAGDFVLQEFASHLTKAIRESDLAVRIGGDEFLLILPDCQLDELQSILARLGSIIVRWQDQQLPVTFSAGWKQYESGERPDDLLAAADQALYNRKRARKMRTDQLQQAQESADERVRE